MRPAWKHQNEACDKFVELRGRMLLRHDMGTGKTRSGCMALERIKSSINRVPVTLIVSPISVQSHWFSQINEFCSAEIKKSAVILKGNESDKKWDEKLWSPHNKVFIVNYEATRSKKWQKLYKAGFEFIILDEGQRIKSPKSITNKEILKLARPMKWMLPASGSFLLNSPEDLWAPLRLLNKGLVDDNFYSWLKKNFYNANADKHWIKFPDWKLIPGREAVIRKLIEDNSHFKLKDDCLDLPPLVKTVVEVEMSPEIKKVYQELEQDFVSVLENGDYIATDLAITKMLRLQEVCNGVVKGDAGVHTLDCGKTAALEDILTGLGDSKCVVWTNFRAPVEEIAGLCIGLGINYATYSGKSTKEEKDDELHMFKTDPSCRVMIATQASGGVGVDGMQVANVAVYYSKNYNLEHDIQSEARTYRGGSEIHKKVTRIDLITKDSIEEKIHAALERKMSLAELLLGYKRELKKAA